MNYLDELKSKFKITENVEKKVNDKIKLLKKIKKHKLSFTLFIEPKAAKRPRTGKYANFYVPDSAKNKKIIRKILEEQLPEDFSKIYADIEIECKYYVQIPVTMSKTDKCLAEMGIIRPITKPDIDNYDKTLFDALNNYLWIDDGLITSSKSEKYYSIKPRIEVKITYRDKFLSSYFNDKKKDED